MGFFRDIKKAYDEGLNINKYIKNENELKYKNFSLSDQINFSYDLQAGSYVKNFFENNKTYLDYTKFIFETINKLKILEIISKNIENPIICDLGTGESTNYIRLLNLISETKYNFETYGMDISLSRLEIAKNFTNIYSKHFIPKFFIGDLKNIPLIDNSISLILTSHSIEPNRGYEEKILNELIRVSNGYIVLSEPIYENGNEKQKKHMDDNGYINCLKSLIYKNQNISVVYESQFPEEIYINNEEYKNSKSIKNGFSDLNKSTLFILKKKEKSIHNDNTIFSCPIEKTKLFRERGFWISKEGSCYPEIDEIPIFLADKSMPFFSAIKRI